MPKADKETTPPATLSPEDVVAQLKASPDFLEGIRAGVAALREGRITPWEEVERELGID